MTLSRRHPANTVAISSPQRGVDGNTILDLAVAPTIDVGSLGDFAIVRGLKRLYGPKTAGGWNGFITLEGQVLIGTDLRFADYDEMQADAHLYAENRGAELFVAGGDPQNGYYYKSGMVGSGSFIYSRPLASIEATPEEAVAGTAETVITARRVPPAVIGQLARMSRLQLDGGSLEVSAANVEDGIFDAAGNSLWNVAPDGTCNVIRLGFADGSYITVDYADWDDVEIDRDGNIGFGWKNGVLYGAGASLDVGYDLAGRNSDNLAAAESLRAAYQAGVTRAVYDYCLMISVGQSLSTGQESWRALSTIQRFLNLMLGESVRPAQNDGTTFPPYGGSSKFKPLVATVDDDGTVYSAGTVAGFSQGNQALGEAPVVGFANMMKWLHNQTRGVANDARKFVAISTGVGGRTIEQLSKGAGNTQDGVNRYGRYTDALSRSAAIAAAESKTVGVVAVLGLHGEYNYLDQGGSWDKASYKAKFARWIADKKADAVAACPGQENPPAFLTYQTSGNASRDVDSAGNPGLHVGMAQWETALATPGVYMVGPSYPYPDKGAHLTDNSSRWIGQQFAKVAHRVLNLGEGWRPLSPRRIERVGLEIFVNYHVPRPPIRFAATYLFDTATLFADRGFRVTDAQGANPVTAVEIVAPTIIRVRTGRAPVGQEHLWYADYTTHDGGGNVADSDDFQSLDLYEYAAGSGQSPAENIASMVGKTYDLTNRSIAFYLPTTWSL